MIAVEKGQQSVAQDACCMASKRGGRGPCGARSNRPVWSWCEASGVGSNKRALGRICC